MEVGQDVALISFGMCGLNAVDIFNAKKDQYLNGIFHYERQKTKKTRKCVSTIEDFGFTNVEQIITRLFSSLTNDIPHPSKVQIKIANLDKGQIQLYQRVLE